MHNARLQQCLPFTVLKRVGKDTVADLLVGLQQCLPFTVLKLVIISRISFVIDSCNSAYRLRY